MPFLTYQISVEQAMQNAGRLFQEGGAAAVKIEGGRQVARVVRRLTSAGLPVMGHIGLTPQHVHRLGGMRRQARDEKAAQELLEDALSLEDAGAFAIVLEAIPDVVAQTVTDRLKIPTIGIGAGPLRRPSPRQLRHAGDLRYLCAAFRETVRATWGTDRRRCEELYQ
jgi:3-methyl-2-oxobutanoate hydroxymethyltransferase